MEQLLGYEYCAVELLDEASQQLVPLAISRKGKDRQSYKKELQPYNFQPGMGVIGWVIQNGEPVCSNDVSREPRYIKMLKGINSELCVPLISRGRTIGVINVETSKPNAYTEKDESLLSALASSAASAIENGRLFESEQKRRQEARNFATSGDRHIVHA